MTLGQTQRAFASCVGQLLHFIDETPGWSVSFDWAYRPPECAKHLAIDGKGIINSNHTRRLAIDLNFFRGDEYITDSRLIEPFGIAWEGLHPLARWGGRFSDGGHFSFQWGGVR